MKKTLTLFLLSLVNMAFVSNATDLVVGNFEGGTPVVTTKYGATFSTVANPVVAGLNTTANCGKIGRTTGNWWELVYFPASFTVAANTTSYVHILVNYPAQPDISMRVDATSAGADGGADIRALNKYTNFGQWQDLVFPVQRGATGLNVIQIVLIDDAGFENTPAGLVLNNTDKFGYIDEIIVNSSSEPRTVTTTALNELNNTRLIYTRGMDIVIDPVVNCEAQIYELTGKLVWNEQISNRVSITMKNPGIYFVKAGSETTRVIVN
jgi:hypothetical protein